MDIQKITEKINQGGDLTEALLGVIPGVGNLARLTYKALKALKAPPQVLKPFEDQMTEWDGLVAALKTRGAEWRETHPEEPAGPVDDSQV